MTEKSEVVENRMLYPLTPLVVSVEACHVAAISLPETVPFKSSGTVGAFESITIFSTVLQSPWLPLKSSARTRA